jgi:lactoylglutathione lyase
MKKSFCYGLLVVLFVSYHTNVMSQEKKRPTFNHMALYVTNLEKSTWFYKEVLNLEPMPEPFHDGRHSWFKVGEHSQLHIISGATAAKEHEKDTHLCFSVGKLSDMIERLEKNNIPYENWAGESKKQTKRADGVMQIYLKDPDGYWLEINDDKF